MRGAVEPSGTCRVCGGALHPGARFCGECGATVGLDRPSELEQERVSLAPVADPLQGRVLADRYRILRCIGRGGMGVVYEVEHVHIGKRLAMKLLHGELASDPDTVRRLRREAEAASRLSDSGTVQVFDFGTSDGLAYLVMELVEGEDLSVLLRREGAMPFARIARLVVDVCASLAEAHELGIVHRDLKPENVMVVKSQSGERAKVLDFGLAILRSAASQSVSRPGAIVGTPHYMAPEQIRGEPVDARTDIYSLGALLYRAVTGVVPLTGESAIVVLTRHLSVVPELPSSRLSGLDGDIDHIIMRCLEKSRVDRFASAHELAAALVEWLDGNGIDLRRRDPTGSVPTRQRDEAIATRRDIDDYEHGLKRRGRLATALLGIGGLMAVGAAAYGLVRAASPPDAPTHELEPNQDPEHATRLVRGIALRGTLGRRLDRERGDVDVYRLVREGEGRGAIRASVSGLPNLDIVLEVYRAGLPDPVLRVDDHHGANEGESFHGFPVSAGEHLVVVRERWIRGAYPTENVSDSYVITWDEVDDAEEPLSDSIERAREVEPGVVARGGLGWATDVDVFCADGPIAGGRWTVSPDATLDVVLALLDRSGHPGVLVDAGGLGAPEFVPVDVPEGARACLRIGRKPAMGGGSDGSAVSGFGALLTVPRTP